MHFLAFVIIPKRSKNIEAAVAKAMAPFSEEDHSRGFWDWYQIGGRWSGHLSGYDPGNDPKNIVDCKWCHASGIRTDNVGKANGFPTMALSPEIAKQVGRDTGYCNGCGGLGRHTTWPTEWGTHTGDVQPASAALEACKQGASEAADKWPHTLIANGEALRRDRYVLTKRDFVQTPDFEKKVLATLAKAAKAGDVVVVVDCHS